MMQISENFISTVLNIENLESLYVLKIYFFFYNALYYYLLQNLSLFHTLYLITLFLRILNILNM